MNNQIEASAEKQASMARVLDNKIANMTMASTQATIVAKSTVEDALIFKALCTEYQAYINRFTIEETLLNDTLSAPENAKIFIWDESYSVGSPEIDRQHQVLLKMLNELVVLREREYSIEFIGRTLEGLINYTSFHFTYEEHLLELHNYVELEAHKISHQKMIDKVLIFQQRFEQEEGAILEDLIKFLSEWLLKHIKIEDKKYIDTLAGSSAANPNSDDSLMDQELF